MRILSLVFGMLLMFPFMAQAKDYRPPDDTLIALSKPQQEESALARRLFHFSIAPSVGLMRGHATYQIGGHVDDPTGSYDIWFPLSELIFPLNVTMGGMDFTVTYDQVWRLKTELRKNITSSAGNMKDSDWGIPWENPPGSGTYYWYGPDSLDIYSESTTELDAFVLDVDVMGKFAQTTLQSAVISFHGGLGYRYQDYNFKCSLIQQWDNREGAPPSEKMDYIGDGSVALTYDVTTKIPYAKIASTLAMNNVFNIEASVGYSPFVRVQDKDNHLLSSKLSYGDCDGTAVLLSLNGRLDVLHPVFFEMAADYISIDTKGKQTQYTNGSWSGTLDQKYFSTVNSLELLVGYKF